VVRCQMMTKIIYPSYLRNDGRVVSNGDARQSSAHTFQVLIVSGTVVAYCHQPLRIIEHNRNSSPNVVD
jgi:hypothetical protein